MTLKKPARGTAAKLRLARKGAHPPAGAAGY